MRLYTQDHLAYLKAQAAFGKENYAEAESLFREAKMCYQKIKKEAQDAKQKALDVWGLLPLKWQWGKKVEEVIKWSNEKALRAHFCRRDLYFVILYQ